MAGAFPDVAHFVLSAQQLLASSITPQVADTLRSVLVYGADLHAFDVLGTLISAGVNAGEQGLQGGMDCALPAGRLQHRTISSCQHAASHVMYVLLQMQSRGCALEESRRRPACPC